MPEKTLRDCGVQQYGYPIFKLLVEVYPQKLFPCASEQCGPDHRTVIPGMDTRSVHGHSGVHPTMGAVHS